MRIQRTRLPPLNALRAFEAAARHLNFRLAAEEMGVTHGAVAQHVRGLEAALDVKLFNRLTRGIALTDVGRSYAGHLRRAFEIVTEATAALRPEPSQLVISVTPTFASKWLIPRLQSFTDLHPDIELRIVATESLSNFQSDGVEIAIRQGRPPFGPSLAADLLFEQEMVAVCSPRLIGHPPQALAPDDLHRFTLLHDAHDLWPAYIDQVLERRPRPLSRAVNFNQTGLAIDAAIAGQGITLAGRILVEQEIRDGRLVQAFAPTLRGGSDFYVVTLRRPRNPKPTDTVRRWLLAQKPFS